MVIIEHSFRKCNPQVGDRTLVGAFRAIIMRYMRHMRIVPFNYLWCAKEIGQYARNSSTSKTVLRGVYRAAVGWSHSASGSIRKRGLMHQQPRAAIG